MGIYLRSLAGIETDTQVLKGVTCEEKTRDEDDRVGGGIPNAIGCSNNAGVSAGVRHTGLIEIHIVLFFIIHACSGYSDSHHIDHKHGHSVDLQ